jgi:hypothetical protein
LLRRNAGDQSEFIAVTFWDSLSSLKGFTGEDPEIAIVDPEARSMLTTFDDTARDTST